MAYDYLGLTNEVLARMNEVRLSVGSFGNARGFQVQCKNAVNDSINHIKDVIDKNNELIDEDDIFRLQEIKIMN